MSSKCEDDILDIASSRIAALAAMSSSDGIYIFVLKISIVIQNKT